jgi:hypothetical protein
MKIALRSLVFASVLMLTMGHMDLAGPGPIPLPTNPGQMAS